jgi:hypothetical protein
MHVAEAGRRKSRESRPGSLGLGLKISKQATGGRRVRCLQTGEQTNLLYSAVSSQAAAANEAGMMSGARAARHSPPTPQICRPTPCAE